MGSKFLAISLGAALGANARYWVTVLAAARWGTRFPYGTLFANVSGSFLIGIVMVVALSRFDHNELFRLFLVTGLLGGYTTFSSFSYEVLALIEASRLPSALAYALGSVATSLLGVLLGAAVARQFVD